MLFSVGLLAAYLLIMLFNSIFSGIYGSVAIFYATCILGALTLPSMESLFTIIGMSAGWFITGAPVKKVSKRALYLFNGLCIAASCQGKQKRRHKHFAIKPFRLIYLVSEKADAEQYRFDKALRLCVRLLRIQRFKAAILKFTATGRQL